MFVAEMNQMLDRLDVEDDYYVIAALYQFVSLNQLDVLRQQLQQLCEKNEALVDPWQIHIQIQIKSCQYLFTTKNRADYDACYSSKA